jgi:hypothetical protein
MEIRFAPMQHDEADLARELQAFGFRFRDEIVARHCANGVWHRGLGTGEVVPFESHAPEIEELSLRRHQLRPMAIGGIDMLQLRVVVGHGGLLDPARC